MAAKSDTPKTAKKSAPKSSGAPRTDGIHKPVTPSADLAAIVGEGQLPRSEVVSKVWEYIKKHDLQNPKDKREILADARLEKIFGKKSASMFEMNKHLSAHLK
jgi:upstream activation factor subunit UAF30